MPDNEGMSEEPVEMTGAPAPPPPRSVTGPYRICLVCMGNICRSPTVEVLLRAALDRAGLAAAVRVDSAGTGDWHIGDPMDARAQSALADHLGGKPGGGARHRAKQFRPGDFPDRDLVLAMDARNLDVLIAIAPPDVVADGRLRLLRDFDPAAPAGAEVPDPYYGGTADYERVIALAVPAVRGLVARLAALLGRTG